VSDLSVSLIEDEALRLRCVTQLDLPSFVDIDETARPGGEKSRTSGF
jgi:hypothetical protein